MCGISGYILKNFFQGDPGRLLGLLDGIRRRGPDDEGVCLVDSHARSSRVMATNLSDPLMIRNMPLLDGQALPTHDVALLHARYAIIDTSTGGHQPFQSQDGSISLVFNGEIYNYLELRAELELDGVTFRTSSDTEVLVEGYSRWRDDLWRRLNGFWAVALYDARENRVVLSRDRLGVAPLYYRETEEGFFFSSLIKPLLPVASGRTDLDGDMLQGFIDTGLKDHEGRTFYQGIRSLPSATVFSFAPGEASLGQAKAYRFWSLPERALTEQELPWSEAVRTMRELVFDAVGLRLRADVKLGFELSGGLDSSSVVAAAAVLSNKKLTTYTLKVRGRDEEPFARAMCRRYHLDYRVIQDLEDDLASGCEDFAGVMEEPYDTPANYLHHVMLKKMKAEGIHVILTGAGGDEALAGYESAFWPKAYREWQAQGLGGKYAADRHEFCRRFKTFKETRVTLSSYARKFMRPSSKAKTFVAADTTARRHQQGYGALDLFGQRRYHVEVGLLPYYLRSTDHYTMNIPLEHRFPFLDYRLVEFGMRLPVSYLFHHGWTKYILRKAMEPYLPSKILWRRQKFGFPFDFGSYFAPHEAVFTPYLNRVSSLGIDMKDQSDYAALTKADPVRLWRLLSVGLWAQAEGRG